MTSLPEHIAHAITNRGLKLILNTTEQCNLRCLYCYETFTLKRMPKGVVNGVLQLIERRAEAGLDWLEVEFFGGEPLAAWDVLKKLASRTHAICTTHKVQLLGAITTNATLLNQERIIFLISNSFKSFQITLDGPQEIHDQRRISRKGRGTFEAIWQNLKILKQSTLDFEVMLRIHFDASTVDVLKKPKGFLDMVVEELLAGDERFILHFNPIEQWSGITDSKIKFFSNHFDQGNGLNTLVQYAQSLRVSARQLPQGTTSHSKGESGHVVCYASRSNSFVIRSDGNISKCTVAFEDDRNIIGRIDLNGEMQIDHERHMPWLRGLISGDAKDLSCPAIGLIWPSG